MYITLALALRCPTEVPTFFLTRTLKHAKIICAQGFTEETVLFIENRLNALAGLRPALMEELHENETWMANSPHFNKMLELVKLTKRVHIFHRTTLSN
ncbi:MAG: hypothetical protein CFH41_02250 [Alphaproteobacteria bacterium MarineAlpha11_Bin1]|nr:MAG: hypothetical protein CFH41_02250 [Alphaproteobacteria bacterium MarineAlpha11_Bin1]